jgi:hypothetical protein
MPEAVQQRGGALPGLAVQAGQRQPLEHVSERGAAIIRVEPKTEAGRRVLPLDAALVAALKAFKARQAAERLVAGPAYQDGGYVTCDELGMPGDPARLRRVWYRLMAEAQVPRITPYTASRHAAGSYLGRAGCFARGDRGLARSRGRGVHLPDLRPRPTGTPRRGARRAGGPELRRGVAAQLACNRGP